MVTGMAIAHGSIAHKCAITNQWLQADTVHMTTGATTVERMTQTAINAD